MVAYSFVADMRGMDSQASLASEAAYVQGIDTGQADTYEVELGKQGALVASGTEVDIEAAPDSHPFVQVGSSEDSCFAYFDKREADYLPSEKLETKELGLEMSGQEE